MKSLNEKLAQLLATADQEKCAELFQDFCREHESTMPLPGENSDFDKAMWTASAFTKLSNADLGIVDRVANNIINRLAQPTKQTQASQTPGIRLKDLVGATKSAAFETWQELLKATSWQQLIPVGAMRGAGTQILSLGTIQQEVGDVTIQINLGWHVEQEHLRLLMQAKDKQCEAMPDVEVRIAEPAGHVVFSRLTNEDGAVVAPDVAVKPGSYKIQVLWSDNLIETPVFSV
jgi:hypothetical protein